MTVRDPQMIRNQEKFGNHCYRANLYWRKNWPECNSAHYVEPQNVWDRVILTQLNIKTANRWQSWLPFAKIFTNFYIFTNTFLY